MQFRIGDRDPATGLYDVIWPDGSSTRNGLKIFNAAHQFGDVVLATQRSDGMMILDSVKAFAISEQTSQLSALPTPNAPLQAPLSYLTGQVWNNDDEPVKPTVSIAFAPSSSTQVTAGQGFFTIRVSVNRFQRNDLKVFCQITGTAASTKYTTAGIDNSDPLARFVIIPAGLGFVDVTITTTSGNQATINETVILSLVTNAKYLIGQPSSLTATILPVPTNQPTVNIRFRNPLSNLQSLSVGAALIRATRSGSTALPLTLSLSYSGTFPPSEYLANPSNRTTVTIPAGSSFVNFGVGAISPSVYTNYLGSYGGNETIIVTLGQSGNYIRGGAFNDLTLVVPTSGQT